MNSNSKIGKTSTVHVCPEWCCWRRDVGAGGGLGQTCPPSFGGPSYRKYPNCVSQRFPIYCLPANILIASYAPVLEEGEIRNFHLQDRRVKFAKGFESANFFLNNIQVFLHNSTVVQSMLYVKVRKYKNDILVFLYLPNYDRKYFKDFCSSISNGLNQKKSTISYYLGAI